MLRRTVLGIAATAVAAIVAAGVPGIAQEGSGLTLFLPGSGAVPGWNMVAAAERDAADEKGLYDAYDGAVPDMQKRGVCYAHQRMFRNSARKTVTIDIYTLYGWQWAKNYYVAERDAIKSMQGFRTWQIKREACGAQGAGTTTAWMWAHNYVACATVQGATAADLTTAKAFVTAVSEKIKAYYGS